MDFGARFRIPSLLLYCFDGLARARRWGRVAPQWSKRGQRLSALFAVTDEAAAMFLANFLVIASLKNEIKSVR
jgi:hypothetical protein